MSEDLDALWKAAKPTAYAGATPALSNAMDATDAAGGVVDVKVGKDGKVIENLDALWNAAKPTKPTVAKTTEQPFDLGRMLALGGRAAAQGVMSLPLMAADAFMGGPVKRAAGDKTPSPMDALNAFFNKHSYTPETSGERIASDVVQGAAGGLMGGGPAQYVGTALAGGAGGLASGGVRESGGGAMAQLGAGLLGNLGTAGALGALNMGKRAIGNVLDRSVLQGGDERGAAAIMNIAAGKQKDAIVQELKTGKSVIPGMPMDAGELAARTNNAEFPALIDLVKRQAGTEGVPLHDAKLSALQNYLQTLSKSNNPNARKEVIDELNTRLGPDLQKAYGQANLAGTRGVQYAADAEKLGEASTRRGFESLKNPAEYGGPQARADMFSLGKDARVAGENVAYIKGLGYNPLSGVNLAQRVESYLKKPGDMASDAIMETMGPLGAKLRKFSDANGVIDSRNIHTIRKEIADSIAANALAKGWDSRRTASVEMSIKSAIDDAMEQAGATGWRKWLGDYQQGMKSANDITVGREIEKTLFSGSGKVRNEAFLKSLENATQSPDMLRKSGMARFGNVDQAMSDQGRSIKDNIAAYSAGDARTQLLAEIGMPKAQKAIGAAFDPIPQVNALYRPLMILNMVTRQLEGKGGKRAMEALTNMALNDPKALAAAMEKLKPAEKASFFDVMRRAAASQAGLLGTQQ